MCPAFDALVRGSKLKSTGNDVCSLFSIFRLTVVIRVMSLDAPAYDLWQSTDDGIVEETTLVHIISGDNF
jgi:hypothetical protein